MSETGDLSSKHHATTIASVDIDPHAERALVRKFDFRLLPVLALMYLFNSLDKSNLGNAKTAGLEDTLHLHGNQYNLILSIFFIPYVLTAPFLGLLGKKFGPNRVLPCMMLMFGMCTILVVATFNFSGIFAIRWFLGMAESAFFPLVIYYLTTFYRRGELARRLAIFYAAQSIASAFSGLLAFGVFRIHSGPLAPWRYLFLIEGGGTVLFAGFAMWFLPMSAAKAQFLSPEEKELACLRLQIDSSAVIDEKLNIRDAFRIFKHGTSWAIIAIQICLGVPLQGVQLFLPVIIKRLGYSTVKTNLYTVAPNVSGAAVLLILAFCSDWTRWRFPFIALGFLFTFIGMVIYAAIDVEKDLSVAYFACFMMTWGTSAPSVLLDVWYNNNIASESRRVVLTSIAVPMANLMGVVSSNIFRSQDAPKYIPALVTTAAFGGTGIILTLCLGLWMIIDNKKRDRVQGVHLRAKDIPTESLQEGPASEDFRCNVWYLAWNLGCGFARTKAQLFAFRFLAGIGGSALLAIGGGAISDMWSAEERGKSMGVYTLGPLLGPVVGPIAGGFIAEYSTWHWVFWSTSAAAVAVQIVGFFCLKECHPGTLLRRRRDFLAKQTGNGNLHTVEKVETLAYKFLHAFERPVRMFTTQPIVLCMAIYMAYLFGVTYLMFPTFPEIWTVVYHESPGIGGLNYLSIAIGSFIGLFVNLKLVDRIYRILKAWNNDVGKPEFRMPSLDVGSVISAIGLFWYGWSIGNTHWIMPNIGALIYTMGTISCLQGMQTYNVDGYQTYAASAMAACAVLRSLCGFAFPLFAPYMYNTLGYGWGTSVLAFITIIFGWGSPFFFWQFGPRLRSMSEYASG